MLKPLQTSGLNMIGAQQARTMPKQSSTVPMQVSAAQTNGLDITAIFNLMIPIMIIGMMMKMMTGVMGKVKA